MRNLLYISIIMLLFSGCRTRKHITATSYTDSISVIETLKPHVFTIPADSLHAVFQLAFVNTSIQPQQVSVESDHGRMLINIDSTGTVQATATRTQRTETVYIPQRSETRNTTRSSEIEKTSTINSYPRWLVIPAMIGVAAIVFFLFKLYKRIRRKFPP